MNKNQNIAEKLKLTPPNFGVYLMKNSNGKIIYIGKAKNLKRRISSYFTKKNFDQPKTEILVANITNFEYIVTRTELDALILEANLIKKYRPKYNIALKDSEKYPYIEIDVKSNFPRAIITRNIAQNGAKYFGPYTKSSSIRHTLHILQKIFRLRTCNKKIPKTNSSYEKPCLNFQIHKCDAPCIGKIDFDEYKKKIEQVILFLKGQTNLVIEILQEEMEKAAGENLFEKAAEFRDQIRKIKSISTRQIVSKISKENLDIIGISQDENLCCSVVMKIREGKLIKREHYFLDNTFKEKIPKILSQFLAQYYSHQEDIPQKILLQKLPRNNEIISEWLYVKIFIPQKGDKKKLLEMAKQNASLLVEEKKLSYLKSSHKTVFAVKELKDKLRLSKLPRKIVAFDVSNLQGNEAVASMVFFDNGKPKKSQYRRFKIKTVEGINDYLMLEEAMTRYLSHLDEEQTEIPDLIIVDGGKGQLTFAEKALEKYSYKIELFSIAKKLEQIFSVSQKEPIIIPKTSYALKLLQQIRNEAHRFAIKYHKNLRDKKTKFSKLDKISGIGEARKNELLKHFKSVKNIANAKISELISISGINKKLARKILDFLNKNGQ
ncbi:MAG: excinuclease ABC subunit UvrC [Candidatus Cloacimonetes bacterium]|nr:excinuclease ABC subunit UvrC [Candidatus Cloacimonadota bacterium]